MIPPKRIMSYRCIWNAFETNKVMPQSPLHLSALYTHRLQNAHYRLIDYFLSFGKGLFGLHFTYNIFAVHVQDSSNALCHTKLV